MSIETLAGLMGMAPDALAALAKKAPFLYRERHEPKKKGGTRLIEAPHDVLKTRQRLLLHSVLELLPIRAAFFGRKGTSVLQAVLPHCHKPMVITMDIRDFFPSVTPYMAYGILRRRGASETVAKLITRLVTRNNHLPQGAPTSSYVAALVLNPAVEDVCAALKSIEQTDISVYADDVTLSGPKGLTRMKGTIIKIFKRHGFDIHTGQDKLRSMSRTGDQIALGIRINDGPEPTAEFIKQYEAARQELGNGHRRTRGMRAFVNSLRAVQEDKRRR